MLKKKYFLIDDLYKVLILSIIPIALLAPAAGWILLIVLALASILLNKENLKILRFNSSESYFPFLLLLYIFITLIWSENPYQGFLRSIELLIMYLCLLLLINNSKYIINAYKLKKFFIISLLLGYIIVISDLFFFIGIKSFFISIYDYILYKKDFVLGKNMLEQGNLSGAYNRGLSVLFLFSLLGIYVFRNEKKYLLLIIASTFLCIFLSESSTLKITTIAIGILYLLICLFKTKIIKICLFLTVGSILFLPYFLEKAISDKWNENQKHQNLKLKNFSEKNLIDRKNRNPGDGNKIAYLNIQQFLLDKMNYSYLIIRQKAFHRLVIWDYTSQKIIQKPFLGYGIYSSRKHGQENSLELVDTGNYASKDGLLLSKFPSIPLHPHNNILQIHFELGLIGAVLFSIIYKILLEKIHLTKKSSFRKNSILLLIYYSVFFINQSSFGLWQTWWIANLSYLIIFINIFSKLDS